MQVSFETYLVIAEMAITLVLVIIIFKEIDSLFEKVNVYINAMNALIEEVATSDNEAIDHMCKIIEDLKHGHDVKDTERPIAVRNREMEKAKRKFSDMIDKALKKEIRYRATIRKYIKQVLLIPVLVLFLSFIFYAIRPAFLFILPLTIIFILAYLHVKLHFELQKEITELIKRAKEIAFPKTQNPGC